VPGEDEAHWVHEEPPRDEIFPRPPVTPRGLGSPDQVGLPVLRNKAAMPATTPATVVPNGPVFGAEIWGEGNAGPFLPPT